MRELLILAIHLLVTVAKLLRPGGVRAVAAESLLLNHQLLISNRSRQRAPNLTTLDRVVLGLTTLFVNPRRITKLGALIKPATLFQFHKALVDRKYRLLFSASSHRRKPGPKGPSAELIAAIVEMKWRNPRFGCVRIAQQISHVFGIAIDKDVVRRVLAKHDRPGDTGSDGPSWLTFIAQTKDSLWSMDLFRCESILLSTHWVLVVIDVFTRRIIGFGVEPAISMVCPSAACSTTPLLDRRSRNASAAITTRCSAFTVGWPICAYSRSRKSSLFRTRPFRIRSSNGSLGRSGVSTSIGHSSGMLWT